VLRGTLPCIIVLAGDQNICKVPLHPFSAGPLTAEMVIMACVLLQKPNHKIVYSSRQEPRVALSIIFNATASLVTDENLESNSVSVNRVRKYQAGRGTTCSLVPCSKIALFYHSLQEVKVAQRDRVAHNPVSPVWSANKVPCFRIPEISTVLYASPIVCDVIIKARNTRDKLSCGCEMYYTTG
jgi:hypothetical protein